MNVSLINDIIKRQNRGHVFTSPGCLLTFVEHPNPYFKKRLAPIVEVVMEHRFAFATWLKIKQNGLRYSQEYTPPDLLTLDWHNDVGGKCDFTEKELKRLNQNDEKEVALFCWLGLHSLNDGHIAPAMWLDSIGDVYAVIKQRDILPRNYKLIDRNGKIHNVKYFRSPMSAINKWKRGRENNGIIWDIDLDYFTQKKEVADQRYTPMLSDKAIAKELDIGNEWVRIVLSNLRGITIALEPKYTGGLSNSLHLFEQWERAFFEAPLWDKNCRWKINL